MNDWYYKQDEQILGPVSRQELTFLKRSGRIRKSTQVREGQHGQWQPLSSQPAFAAAKAGAGGAGTVGASVTARGLPNTALPAASQLDSGQNASDAAPAADSSPQPNLPPDPDSAMDQRTKRQTIAGVVLGIILLLLLAVLWNQTQPTGGLGSEDGNGRNAALPPGDAAGNSPLAASDNASQQTAQQHQDEASGAGQTAAAEQAAQGTTAESAAMSQAAADSADSGTATGSDQATTQASAAPPATMAEDSELNAVPTFSQAGTVPGDPLSRFTIAAPGEVSFFGVRATGRRFAFVVDRSGSMQGQRLQRAKQELMKCIRELPAHIEVRIVFFDSTAEANPGGYLKLHHRNVDKLDEWVNQISANGGTEVTEGMELLFSESKQPDAVFLLTDGEFDGGTPQRVQTLNQKADASINTVALVSRGGEALLKQIAKQNRGDYRFVP